MGGSAPSPPPPPPPPPDPAENAKAQEKKDEIERRLRAKKGRVASLLTGAQGDTSEANVKKKKLGD